MPNAKDGKPLNFYKEVLMNVRNEKRYVLSMVNLCVSQSFDTMPKVY